MLREYYTTKPCAHVYIPWQRRNYILLANITASHVFLFFSDCKTSSLMYHLTVKNWNTHAGAKFISDIQITLGRTLQDFGGVAIKIWDHSLIFYSLTQREVQAFENLARNTWDFGAKTAQTSLPKSSIYHLSTSFETPQLLNALKLC